MKNKGQKKDLLTFLDHPNNDIIRFSNKYRCFKCKKIADKREISVRGLVPVLKKNFWSKYEYIPPKYKTRKTEIKNRFDGLLRGDLVHRQIETYVNRGVSEIKKEEIHPFTKKAIIAMREWKWKPIIAELPIYDPILKIATKIDLICLDKDDNIVLVEWKCGMDNYLCQGNTVMDGPLSKSFSNCPLNQALLQLLFTKMIVQKNYNIIPKKAYVVQIHSDGINPFSLPKRMETFQELCYQYLHIK